MSITETGDKRRLFGSEREFVAYLKRDADLWLPAVEIDGGTIDVEVPIAPEGTRAMSGAPRADMVIRGDHADAIVEVKRETNANAIIAGVGQLLYYRAVYEAAFKRKANRLVLAVSSLPPFLDLMIESIRQPITVLHVTDQHFVGYVPKFGETP